MNESLVIDKLGRLRTELTAYVEGQRNLQKQLDAIDARTQGAIGGYGSSSKGLDTFLRENESLQKLLKDGRGTAVLRFQGADANLLGGMQRKTVITETTTGSIGTDTGSAVGLATTGVLPIARIPGIVPEARYVLRLRDVLFARPTTAAVIDYVRVTTPPTVASPVVEASVKPENSVAFTAYSEKVRTLATWIPATRQVLDDLAELRSYIDGALAYQISKVEELELLSGDGTGEHLHGILPQAASFTTGLLSASAGYQRLDIIAEAIAQIAAAAEMEPSFIVVNTADWWKLRLTKDSYGRYILGDPQNAGMPGLWNVAVVPSNSIAAGTFLVGSGSPAAIEICDRMDTTVEISTEHNDYFIRNMVAIRAEKRVALIVKRPAAFVTGSLTTSPVS